MYVHNYNDINNNIELVGGPWRWKVDVDVFGSKSRPWNLEYENHKYKNQYPGNKYAGTPGNKYENHKYPS